jgi:hypothetical protein
MPLLFALLISFVWMAGNAFAAKLLDVRTGKKSGFTRLVFQFEAPPRFQVQDEAAPGQLSITFLETTADLPPKKRIYTAPVKSIAINQDGSHLSAVAALSIAHFRLKSFTLIEPHRVVFDIYPAAAAESIVKLNKLVVKESAEAGSTATAPPPPTVEVPEQPAKEPEPTAKKPELGVAKDYQPPEPESTSAILGPVQEPKEPEPPAPVKNLSQNSSLPTAAPAQPTIQPAAKTDSAAKEQPMPSTFGTFQRNLIIVLAGISIVILALIGVLLMQKKNNTAKGRPVEPVQDLKTTADIMASIDARIKEKFKQYEAADKS